MSRRVSAFVLTTLFIIAPLAGCFGDDEAADIVPEDSLQIDFIDPQDAVLRSGEFHDFTLEGKGNAISTEPDVMIFINGTYVVSHSVMVEDNTVYGQFLTTPYVTEVNITFMADDGQSEIIKVPITEGTPIVNGEEWFRKIDFITSVCTDTTKCGGYVNRWMGAGNGFFERAAEYFKGQFEGLGYETYLL